MTAEIATQVLNAIYAILLLAQIALGLAVVMGLLGVLNIAHGDFIMVGAFTAYVVQKAGLPYAAAVPAAALVCGLLGLLVEAVLIRPLKYDPFETLLATWGLGLLLRESADLLFGRGFRNVDVPLPGAMTILGIAYPIYRLVLIGVSVAILGALAAWYLRTRTGARIRAMVGNPVLAETVGIPTRQLARGTFVAGIVCAGLAGVMIAPLTPVEPNMGLTLVVNAFFTIVVGGMGTLAGLLGGAAIMGGIQTGVAAVVDPITAYLAMLILAVLFLWRRPRGIFSPS